MQHTEYHKEKRASLHAYRLSSPPNTICTARCHTVYHIDRLLLAKECNRTKDPNGWAERAWYRTLGTDLNFSVLPSMNPSITPLPAVLSLCGATSQMSAARSHLENQAWRALPPAVVVWPETALPPPVSPPYVLTESMCGCWGPWESLFSVSSITSGMGSSGNFYKRFPTLGYNRRMWTTWTLAITLDLTSLL